MISRFIFATAFLLGAAAIVSMGLTFAGSNLLGLTVTAVIGGVYIIGFTEILRFRQATSTLVNALSGLSPTAPEAAPDFLDRWLNTLHPSLQNSVRLRIEGERVGLPAPVLTPYLVSLLVMLGLLGTFLGMVATLQGAVLALEGTTELQAIRAGLAAPIKGLGLAFGTSVAGVAASAMLGLIAALSRRDRISATRQLDGQLTTVFREFSLVYNRQQAFKAMQAQANVLPQVAERLHALAGAMERMCDQLGDKLIANQEQFHRSAGSTYSELASSLDRSLRESIAESGRQAIASGRLAGESIKPLLAALITDIGQEAQRTHQQLTLSVEQQLAAVTSSLADSLQKTAADMADNTRASTSDMVAEVATLLHSSEALVRARIDAEATWLQGHGERMKELTSTLRTELQALRDDEQGRGQAAVDRLSGLQSSVASQLASLGKALEEPMTRLVQTASEAPRAAAEVIAHLRREISNNIERDNSLLEERQQILTELGALSASLQQATNGQREAVESLLNSSATMLGNVGCQFSAQVESGLSTLSGIADGLASNATRFADDFAGSAIEISSLGEAFTLAVNLFNESNNKLVESLDHIEQSLDRSTTRSDEQLAYYVSQARAIIDHSLLSQKEIFDELRQLRQHRESVPERALDEVA